MRGTALFGRLDELDPFAVEARYGMVAPIGLDRGAVSRMVEAIIDWARAQVAPGTAEGR
jgi:hypothetical protein